jgi:serine/threonine protein kinase/tetratricopeptide (TPR) repeat protein
MSSDRHARVKEIFLAACELPSDERAAYLDRACADDDALRREVESLLEFHEEPDGGETRTKSPEGDASADPPRERIAGYRLVRKIGEGGMGIVYEADQLEPVRRRVAVKVIKVGMDTRQVVARFETERQALALMDHPNIARILDAGATEQGRPFFAMEYVSGEPITDYCDRQRLDTRERLELFIQVCDGIRHAHQKGIIHRDIKPSNVMVRILDDRPVPSIIDFGIAKATQHRLTDSTMHTAQGMLIGTPEYMSPEQAEMTGHDVDTRTDIYSLGVVLYELLVGALPLDSTNLREAGIDEIRRRIRDDQPSKPSTRVTTLGEATTCTANRRRTDPPGLRRLLRGDLDWITLKALEKDRTRRYGSASERSADIARHLRPEPVLAGPPSAVYRTRKFVRRHRIGVVASAALVAVLLGGVVGTTVGFVRAKREAETARRVSSFLRGMFRALDPDEWGENVRTPEEMLDRGVERLELELEGLPLVQADLMLNLGTAYRGLGQYDRTRALYEGAVAIHREHLGTDNLDYALSISFLGDLLGFTGSYEEARQLHEQALAIRRKRVGPDHLWVGWSLRSLGWLHWRTSDLKTARSLYMQALEIIEDHFDSDHLDVAATLYFLAQVESDNRDFEAARIHFSRALAIRERALGPEHPEVAAAQNDLGRIYLEIGDRATALPYFERALATCEQKLGPDHLRVVGPLTNIASVLISNGDLDGARTLLDRSLELQEASIGVDHPDLAFTLRVFGMLHLRTGDIEAARAAYARALTILENNFSPKHAAVALIRMNLGYLEYHIGNYEEARQELERALEIQRESFGAGHRATSGTLYNLACLSAVEGRREEALNLLREAVDSGFDGRAIFDDPDLTSLRGDPEFESLVDQVRAHQKEGDIAI